MSSARGFQPSDPVVDALTFDIEDWFHLVGIDAVADPDQWPALPSLVERYTHLILGLLEETGSRATFFVLGWIADRYPHLVRSIAQQGHELATHSYWHRKVFDLTPEQFRADLDHSIAVIEAAGDQKVMGFRAPSFSIVPGGEWAFDVMLDAGLRYDSSLFPAPRDDGGYPCPQGPHWFKDTPSGGALLELPISVLGRGAVKVPFSGGGYVRLLPRPVIRYGFRRFHGRGLPVVVYLHPRDFAPDCPRVPMPLRRRFQCYVGLASTFGKLRMLLERYRFDSCAAVLGLEQ